MKGKIKKITSFLLLFYFSLFLVISGCNRGNKKNTNTSLSETSVSVSCSEETSGDAEHLAKERKWEDYYSDEVLEEIHNDKIKYTLYVNYNKDYRELDFYLPVDIKTYVDHDNMTYDMYQVLDDYGWQKEADYYYYVVDDLMVKLLFQVSESSQIEMIRYDFAYKDNPEECYYTYLGWHPTDNMWLLINFLPGCHCDYLIEGSDGLYVTYEESIVLTYIISWVSVRPYTNPLIFVPHFSIEINEYAQHDKYYINFE